MICKQLLLIAHKALCFPLQSSLKQSLVLNTRLHARVTAETPNSLQPTGHYMYRTVVTICTTRFNIHTFYILPTQYIYVFCVDLRTNSDYFPIQH